MSMEKTLKYLLELKKQLINKNITSTETITVPDSILQRKYGDEEENMVKVLVIELSKINALVSKSYDLDEQRKLLLAENIEKFTLLFS